MSQVGVLLAASTLALPSSTQPANAVLACDPDPNIIPTWSALYDDRGVTMCLGEGLIPLDEQAYVQIIDLQAGAKLRMLSDPIEVGTNPPWVDYQYNKRQAGDWFDWIQQSNIDTPASDRLFSATNASFFVDTSSETTALSLPKLSRLKLSSMPIGTGREHVTFGRAYYDNEDPAWDGPKRAFMLEDARDNPQGVVMYPFPTHYTWADVYDVFDFDWTWGSFICGATQVRVCWDGIVGFEPLYDSGDPSARRTLVGTDGSKVYILTTADQFTLSEAQDILKSFGSQTEIQLDGGGSTQIYYEDGPIDGGLPSWIFRQVPDVLAVYLAPE